MKVSAVFSAAALLAVSYCADGAVTDCVVDPAAFGSSPTRRQKCLSRDFDVLEQGKRSLPSVAR